MDRSIFKTAVKEKFLIISLLLLVSVYAYFVSERNQWYLGFYENYQQKKGIYNSIFNFFVINGFIILIDASKAFLQLLFKVKQRRNFDLKKTSFNLAQRIAEDPLLWSENFIKAFVEFSSQILILAIFIPRVFVILGWNGLYIVLGILFSSSGIVILNFGYIKKLIQRISYVHEEKEGNFRKFLELFFSQNAISRIRFDYSKLEEANEYLKKKDILDILTKSIRDVYNNIAIILPFALLYSSFVSDKINWGMLMLLVNLWTQVHLAIIGIAKAFENLIKANVSYRRLKIQEKQKGIGANILIQGLRIIINDNKIIDDFNLITKENEKINIFGENQKGKTTIMKAMQGFCDYEGDIVLPNNIFWIPESPIIPYQFYDLNDEKYSKFIEIFEVDKDLEFENASGSEKWKIIAVYALANNYDWIIWDDPFWGLDAEKYLKTFAEHSNGLIIFSNMKIEDFKVIELE